MSEQTLNFADILDLIGSSDTAIAAAMGVKRTTVRQMRVRGSVHPRHWPALIDAAKRIAGRRISYDMLARIAVAKAPAPPRPPVEEDKAVKRRRSRAAHKGWKRRREMLAAPEDESAQPREREKAEAA